MDIASWKKSRQFNAKKQAKFLHKIERLSSAGLHQKAIINQIITYGDNTERQVATDIKRSLGSGAGFSQGIKDWLSPIAYQSLLAGEHIGDFQQGLKDALNAIETQSTSTTVLAKALAGPMVGIIALLGASALVARFVFPMLEEQLPKRQWGSLASFADSFGRFFIDYGGVLLTLLILSLIALIVALPKWVNLNRKKLDNVLLFRQYRLIHTAHFLTSISHQTLAGIGLKDALIHYQDTAPPYVAWHTARMLNQIRAGITNIGAIFDVGLLNKEEQDTLAQLGEIGKTPETLKKSADMHSELLLHEVALIETLAKNTLKILAAMVFALSAGGLISLIFTIATQQRL
ncbi:hypothetical protein [Aliivibrio salmonicida]|uniref:hypothetical protein n=1 Tax=Aliivibrio salmonicida TaxID=40269 RepID=UPI003D0DF7BD